MRPDLADEPRNEPLSPTEGPLVLTPTEAATALRISRSKLYLLAKTGAIPTVRIGSSLRIPRRALEAFVERGNHDAAT